MVKPTITNITNAYRTKAQALNDGVSFDSLDDRNSAFYVDETNFTLTLQPAVDYVDYGLSVVAGYTDTKLYFDEMLNDGNYLNDLQSYEDRILEYHNTTYGTTDTMITDETINNLSAKEMEELTIPLITSVVYPEHHDQLVIYYDEFRGIKTNAEVYNEIKAYLTPFQQGISRIISTAAENVFVNGTTAYTELITYLDSYTSTTINEVNTAVATTSSNKDITIAKADEATTAAAIATEKALLLEATTSIDGGSASTIQDPILNINGGNANG